MLLRNVVDWAIDGELVDADHVAAGHALLADDNGERVHRCVAITF